MIQEAMTMKMNDMYMVCALGWSDVQLLFLSSLIRTVLSLHDLVKNKEGSLKRKEVKEEKAEESDSSDDGVPIIWRVSFKQSYNRSYSATHDTTFSCPV